MAQRKPLFAGDSEIDQIFKIFRKLGTPKDANWPGVSQLPDFKPTFPRWQMNPLSKYVSNLDANGLDLLQKMLHYDPSLRISAEEALNHVRGPEVAGGHA